MLFCLVPNCVILICMRYLGIDYGEKRIGIAISDPGGRIAFPQKVIYNFGNKYLWKELETLLQENQILEVIVGLPLNFDGEETGQTREVRKFADQLKKVSSVPIEFENEILTTQMAEQAGVKKEHTDEAAAALILQSYLDKLNQKS